MHPKSEGANPLMRGAYPFEGGLYPFEGGPSNFPVKLGRLKAEYFLG